MILADDVINRTQYHSSSGIVSSKRWCSYLISWQICLLRFHELLWTHLYQVVHLTPGEVHNKNLKIQC